MDYPILFQLAGLAGAAATGGVWFGARRARAEIRKTNADADVSAASATESLVDTALKLIEPYRDQLTTQAASIQRLHSRVDLLWRHVGDLETIIRDAGITPPQRPTQGITI